VTERISLYWIFWGQAGGPRSVGGAWRTSCDRSVWWTASQYQNHRNLFGFHDLLTIISTDNFSFSHFGFGSGLIGSVNRFLGYLSTPS
jgi:hypothetical protein